MDSKATNLKSNEQSSVRYLNLFRLLLSFFFFSIIFKKFGSIVGITYTLDIARFIASLYLAVSLLVWIASLFTKKHTLFIGLFALILDLPFILSLTLLFNGLENGWVLLPVITIGSFSILNHKSFSIFAMPLLATTLLLVLPYFLQLDYSHIHLSTIFLYALIYFGIALVGIRQSQAYNLSLLLTQRQKKKITNLSRINELIIDQMNSGVVVFNNEYNIIHINNKAQEIIRSKANKKLPMPLIKPLIANSKNKKEFKTTLFGEDILIKTAILEEESHSRLLIIDQQSQLNKKLQQIELANLGQLSATVAHEIRNPLAAIYSASELLKESKYISQEDRKLTDIIIHQVKRSNRIIEDILLMSKKHVAEPKTINLIDKINHFKESYCQQNNLNPSQIMLDFKEKSAYIIFDNAHLSQLLWNLTENAFKHGTEEIVIIKILKNKQNTIIDFCNRGNALDKIVEESLFTPFFTTHTQGTGLGLFICREMSRSNNAKLEYLRQEPLHVFRLHVPTA
jgi:two-component system sensor histidine kinase PilS (NtrC family)